MVQLSIKNSQLLKHTNWHEVPFNTKELQRNFFDLKKTTNRKSYQDKHENSSYLLPLIKGKLI